MGRAAWAAKEVVLYPRPWLGNSMLLLFGAVVSDDRVIFAESGLWTKGGIH